MSLARLVRDLFYWSHRPGHTHLSFELIDPKFDGQVIKRHRILKCRGTRGLV